MPRTFLAAALAITLLFAASARAIVLVDPDADVEPAGIYYHPGASNAQIAAANELAKYLTQISGQTFNATAIHGRGRLSARSIVFHNDSLPTHDDLSEDSYIIRAAEKGSMTIAAGGDLGYYYAVYGLLEDQLGCRWWTHDEEFVPRMKKIELPDELDITVTPPFAMHDLFNREAQNPNNNFRYKARATSPISFSGGHTICPMLKPYTDEHPDFLPMDKDGQRKWNNIHMNYTAPGMDDALITEMSKLVDKTGNLDHVIYFAGMGDWYGGMDLSPESKAIYEEETWTDPDGRKKPGYIATLLRLMNDVAAELDEKYPGIEVGTFAYMSLEAPPAHTKPADNLHIQVPRLRHDTVLSVLESEENASFLRNLERWCELAPGRVYVWEYGTNFSNFLYPFPCINSIAENLRVYHDMGIQGVMIQGNYTSTGGDMIALKNYVWRKIMWNPEIETQPLIEEFCHGYYGPAGEHVIAYVNALEQSVREPKQIHVDEFGDPLKTYLTPELRAQLRVHIAAARSAIPDDDETHLRRLAELEASLEAVDLWNQGELVAHDAGDKLVRADMEGEYTYPRAVALAENLRGASPREWGTGLSYRRSMITWHGGPLHTIAAGDTAARIAPVQDGMLWNLTHDGETIITRSTFRLSPGAHYFETVSQDEDNVVMKADLGIGHWSTSSEQVATHVWQAQEEGHIKLTAMAQPTGGDATQTVQVATTYATGGSRANVTLAVQRGDQAWTDITLSTDGQPLELGPADAFRIVRADLDTQVTDRWSSTPAEAITITSPDESSVVVTVKFQAAPIPKAAGDVQIQIDGENRSFPGNQVFLTRSIMID